MKAWKWFLAVALLAAVWTVTTGCSDDFTVPDGKQSDGSVEKTPDTPTDRRTPPPDRRVTPDNTDPDKKTDPDKTVTPDKKTDPDKDVTPDKTDPDKNVTPDVPVKPDEPPPAPDEPMRPGLFALMSATTTDGTTINLRFGNKVDPTTGGNISNYRFRPNISIQSAKVEGYFVVLKVAGARRDTEYTVFAQNLKDVHGSDISRSANNVPLKTTLFLNIIWHQHQPMYLDPLKDEMQGPWVRKHATKDYYDMAAVLAPTKDVHMTINLTPVLLIQLQKYIDRMGPFYNPKTNRMDAAGFLAKWRRKTDPWIDLLLRPTPEPAKMSKFERELFYDAPWSTVSTSPQIMNFFPAYEKLRDKNRANYTQQDLRELKFYFELAWFDPSFLQGPVKMPNGWVVDLTDIVDYRNGKYYVKVPITEDLCNRMVAENYKIMANVVGIHKKLQYNPNTKKGQIEIITTPFYHPILPLIYDTNQAKLTNDVGDIKLPNLRFSSENDAFAHIAKAKKLYFDMFGFFPRGMWPGEGSVSEDVVKLFVENGLQWLGTGEHNLHRSKPHGQSVLYAYKVDSDKVQGNGGSSKDEISIVFRDDKISDLIGFGLQSLSGSNSARKLMSDILAKAPRWGDGSPRLLSIILDGENAWENYTQDHDGVRFFKFFYRMLQESHKYKEILTVTPSEYIDGNAARGVPSHPITRLKELEPLNAGSWIDGTFRIWIGEDEETCGWDYLARVRQDLTRAERLWNVTRPNPLAAPVKPGSPKYNAYMAWESLYAAQGSDWFWWFGDDMTSPANDDSGFDNVFRALLTAVYEFANKAGAKLTLPTFRPCVQAKPKPVPTDPCSQCPKVDGKFSPDDSEWTTDGGYMKDNDSADPNKPSSNDMLQSIYFAFDTSKLFVGMLSNFDLSTKMGKNFKLNVYFSHRHIVDKTTGKVQDDKPVNTKTPGGTKLEMKVGGAARRLVLDFSGSKVKATIERANGSGGWTAQTSSVIVSGPISGGKLIEMSIPWKDLNLTVGAKDRDPLQVLVVAEDNSKEIDRAPNFGAFTVFEDASDAVFVTFEVDISNKADWGKYGTCCKQKPRPDGPASVFIVGNHRKLGMVGVDAQGKPIWVPNKIQMNQDKNNPWLWKLTVALPKGMKVNYKYTIGTNSDEGRWRGTEEFPVTFRGFVAKDTTGNRCIRIRDYFANKPTGGRDGEVGSKSKLNIGCK